MSELVERVKVARSEAESTSARDARAWRGDAPTVLQPRSELGYELLDAHAFRNAITAHIAGDAAPLFVVAILKPTLPGTTLRLGEIVLSMLRPDCGDLVGLLSGALVAYLHGAEARAARQLARRVRSEWRRAGLGTVSVEVAAYPAEEYRVIDLLAADWTLLDAPAVLPDEPPLPHEPLVTVQELAPALVSQQEDTEPRVTLPGARSG